MIAPTLNDDAVVLRAITDADVDEWLAGQDDEQVRWFEAPRWSTRDDVVEAVTNWATGWANNGPVWQWAVCERGCGELAGGVELRDLGGHDVNLSYVVFPRFRRRGIATAASRLAISFAATALGARAVVLKILIGNAASLGVARRLGASESGTEPSEMGGTFRVFRLGLD